MAKIFGDFIEKPTSQEYLTLEFSPSLIPIQHRWRNNGLSADFLAQYLTAFFPTDEDDADTLHRQAQIKGAVSYITNELLENAMKFNDDKCGYPVIIQLQLDHEKINFFVTNSVTASDYYKFQDFINEFIVSEPYDFYIRQLEKNSTEESTSAGLGFLTIINDYCAKLGWKFETIQEQPQILTVTTMVQLLV